MKLYISTVNGKFDGALAALVQKYDNSAVYQSQYKLVFLRLNTLHEAVHFQDKQKSLQQAGLVNFDGALAAQVEKFDSALFRS